MTSPKIIASNSIHDEKNTSFFHFRVKSFRNVREFLYVYNIEPWYPKPGSKLNKLAFPRFVLPCNEDGAKVWNKLVRCLNNELYDKLELTKSGGLKVLQEGNGWFIENTKRGCTLVACIYLNHLRHVGFRVSFENTSKINELGITGRGAYFTMKKEFAKDNINLENYAVENGETYKEDIKKPMIEFGKFAETNHVYQHVSHLDLHSAYPSGIVAKFPELRPTIERIYHNRKKSEADKKLKLTLDAAIGYFQSEYCSIHGNKYALANLAQAGVNWTYDSINQIANELKMLGKVILAFNTDGIWFIDSGKPLASEKSFMRKWIGDGLGKAAIDHHDCKIRFKSIGSYEFIEDGKYYPVVRGSTKLDRIKPREQWQFGDIYQEDANIIMYRLDEKTHQLQGVQQ